MIGLEIPDLDVGSATRAGAGDDFHLAIGEVIASGDIDTTGEVQCVGHEFLDHTETVAIEHLHVRSAAGSGTGDDFGEAIAGQVCRGNRDTAGEGRGVGEEGGKFGGVVAAEGLDMGSATGSGACDDVQDAVMVDIAGGDKDTAGEGAVIGHEFQQGIAGVGTVDDANQWEPAGAHGGDDIRCAVVVEIGTDNANLALEARERCDRGAGGGGAGWVHLDGGASLAAGVGAGGGEPCDAGLGCEASRWIGNARVIAARVGREVRGWSARVNDLVAKRAVIAERVVGQGDDDGVDLAIVIEVLEGRAIAARGSLGVVIPAWSGDRVVVQVGQGDTGRGVVIESLLGDMLAVEAEAETAHGNVGVGDINGDLNLGSGSVGVDIGKSGADERFHGEVHEIPGFVEGPAVRKGSVGVGNLDFQKLSQRIDIAHQLGKRGGGVRVEQGTVDHHDDNGTTVGVGHSVGVHGVEIVRFLAPCEGGDGVLVGISHAVAVEIAGQVGGVAVACDDACQGGFGGAANTVAIQVVDRVEGKSQLGLVARTIAQGKHKGVHAVDEGHRRVFVGAGDGVQLQHCAIDGDLHQGGVAVLVGFNDGAAGQAEGQFFAIEVDPGVITLLGHIEDLSVEDVLGAEVAIGAAHGGGAASRVIEQDGDTVDAEEVLGTAAVGVFIAVGIHHVDLVIAPWLVGVEGDGIQAVGFDNGVVRGIHDTIGAMDDDGLSGLAADDHGGVDHRGEQVVGVGIGLRGRDTDDGWPWGSGLVDGERYAQSSGVACAVGGADKDGGVGAIL